jgi:hypothetical protein
VNHRPRTRGRSKYGLGRTVRVLLDLFTVKFLLAYGTRPAHLFGLWGLASGGAGFLILAYLAYIRLFEDTAIAGRPLALLGVLLCVTGLILVATGLLAEILVRIYHESQGKPIYVVKELLPPAVARERERARPGR